MGNFDLSPVKVGQPASQPPLKEKSAVVPARKPSQVTTPAVAAPVPVAEQKVSVASLETKTPARSDTPEDPDARLTARQKEMLQALDAERIYIRADILVEAENVVRHNITRLSIVPTSLERKIFRTIGIPGF